jgi:hypothetical protein
VFAFDHYGFHDLAVATLPNPLLIIIYYEPTMMYIIARILNITQDLSVEDLVPIQQY